LSEKLGGKVNVISKEGQGSTFEFAIKAQGRELYSNQMGIEPVIFE
jgi:signal transduction histidine kinase